MLSKMDVAHIRVQGVDLIIVPVKPTFQHKSSGDREEWIQGVQEVAASAGLAGTVVPVWENSGYFHWIAPSNWDAYFRSINMAHVWANVNKTLSWQH